MTGRIAVRDTARGGAALEASIVSALVAAMRTERRAMRLSLALVGDAKMRRINARFHGVDACTDVLAFPLGDDIQPAEVAVDGEIVISLTTARREARARRVPLSWEASLYAVHGYLHLCGHEDQRSEAARAMAARAGRILRIVGCDPARLGLDPGQAVSNPTGARARGARR